MILTGTEKERKADWKKGRKEKKKMR